MAQPGSAPPAPAQAARPLRRPALAVLVLAAASILTRAFALVIELVQSEAPVMPYVMQGFSLVLVSVSVLFTASVLWLLSASRAWERRAGSLPLLALGLLTLSSLLAPAAQLLTLLLQLIGVGVDDPSGYSVRYLISSVLTAGGGILLTLSIGVLALVMLLRPERAARTSRIPIGHAPVAVVLLATALLLASMALLQNSLLSALTSGGGGFMAMSTLLTFVMTLLTSLLVPATGLLIALTAGRSHVLVWAGIGAYWLAEALTTVLMCLYALRLVNAPMASGDGVFLAARVVDAVGVLVLAAASAAVLVRLLRGRSHGSAGAPRSRRARIH